MGRSLHIPDGYLGPATCATFYGASVPVWYVAGHRVKKVVRNRYVPLVAIGAASSFLVMMFDVPIPDETPAHAVGAVLLGPWAPPRHEPHHPDMDDTVTPKCLIDSEVGV